ncbi:hypothetical protein DCAR_0520511 [Daucus carota subsp. sativus]|uniref:Formin-like protein n=2 Tax=Daucus carota subsp. sativus TaxID=79200 RepID=A0AAF1B061_DAUCS|nr:PREDICTED: formin-like protein 13 isoform X1 [Daucus carota subsp. sativus]WOH01130.1 hypothetical protein DCAR_0520511 [Daucus carota subsp. sativus]
MALFRRLFYKKPPDGLLEISERVYVFDCCFTTDTWEAEEYKDYVGNVIGQLKDYYPDASILVFNFHEQGTPSQIAKALSEYDITIMDYPKHYEGCPLLPLEVVHHFLRSGESWLSLGKQNVLLMHCERGGWPVLVFMLAALLIYSKQYYGEQKTLDMVYKQAPQELLQLLSPLNPIPSQLRYLQYVSRRNLGTEWPPLDRGLTLDCIIIRMIPNFDRGGGCRPIFHIYGQDPLVPSDRNPKLLFSTPKRSKAVRHYKQAECELVKIDIHCHVQGDVVLECINLHDDMEREEMILRVMFNTSFIRSNILMLNRNDVDMMWNAKDQFSKDFRAEVLFSEMDASASVVPVDLSCFEEKDGLPVEAFAKVQEIFNSVDWLVPKKDATLDAIQHTTSSANNSQRKADVDTHKAENHGNRLPQLSPKMHHDKQPSLKSRGDGKQSEASHRPTQVKDINEDTDHGLENAPSAVSSPRQPLGEDFVCKTKSSSTAPPQSTLTVKDPAIDIGQSSASAPSSTLHPQTPPLRDNTLKSVKYAHPPPSDSEIVQPLKENIDIKTGPTPASTPSIKYMPPPTPSPLHPQTQSPHPVPLKNDKGEFGPPPPPPPPVPALKKDQTINSSVAPPPPPPPTPPLKEELSLKGRPRPPPPPSPPLYHAQVAQSVNSTLVPPPPPPPSTGSSFHAVNQQVPPPPPINQQAPSLPPGPRPLVAANPQAPSPPPPPGAANPGTSSPPPPSIPPSLGRGRGLSRPMNIRNNQTKKLKPLHWLKLTRAVQGSLWAETQRSGDATKGPEIDISELETLFSAAAPSSGKGGPGGKTNSRVPVNKPEKVQLIGHRRAYNCEIMLSKVKIPLNELMKSVLAFDDSALDADQVDNLIKFCPTKEEIELLKNYNGEKDRLGKCEQFFFELMQVPRAESKLRVFSFKLQFESQVFDLRNSLDVINSATEQIRSSCKLKKVMQTILSLGNALNQGTARGSAVGFRLDSLLKLTETRARNNKMTLMHYLCKVLAEKLPELLDFSEDLGSLESSTKIQLKYLAEEMQAISKGLEKVVQELSLSESDGPVSENFLKDLKDFLCFAEGEVRSLASLYSVVGRNVDALILYFGEDPARCTFEQVVSTLLNFVRMFNKAHEENCKQQELDKKKAEKEASSELTKLNASYKEPEIHVVR